MRTKVDFVVGSHKDAERKCAKATRQRGMVELHVGDDERGGENGQVKESAKEAARTGVMSRCSWIWEGGWVWGYERSVIIEEDVA